MRGPPELTGVLQFFNFLSALCRYSYNADTVTTDVMLAFDSKLFVMAKQPALDLAASLEQNLI